MIRILRNISFFLAGFFTVFYTGLTYAETIEATFSQVTAVASYRAALQGSWRDHLRPAGYSVSDLSAICAAEMGAGNGSSGPPRYTTYTSSSGLPSGQSWCGSWQGGSWVESSVIVKSEGVFRCGNTNTLRASSSDLCPADYSCPTGGGWSLSGTNCVRADCAIGEIRDSNGICSNGYQTCAELVVTATGSCVKSVPCGAESSVPLDSALLNAAICSDQKSDPTNCAASGGIVIGMFQGKPICLSPPPDDPTCTALGGTVTGTLNGQPVCSNIAGNPPCPGGGTSSGTLNGQPVCSGSCGAGSAPGTVNGVESCYPIAPTTTKKTTQKSTNQTATTNTSSTDPNTAPTTSNKTSTTQCDGENCTTTTITNNGPGTPTETTTTQQEKGDYCAQNPKASVCTGETEQDKYCEDNPESLACMKAGTPGEEGGLSTVDKSVVSTISPVNIASSAGCPADVQLGKGVYITYAGVCQYAEGLRPVVLASAWLLAGLIVLGMTKGS